MIKFKILMLVLFISSLSFSQEKQEFCSVIFVNNSKGLISLNNLSKFEFRFFKEDCYNEIIGYEFNFSLKGSACRIDSENTSLNENIIDLINKNKDFCKLSFRVKIINSNGIISYQNIVIYIKERYIEYKKKLSRGY